MALNLPNIPKVKALAAKTTPGSKTGASIAGVKVPKNPFGGGAKVKAAAKPAVNPNDMFRLNDPYDPAQISSLAQSGYNADVANAGRLAQMGQPTQASITGDYAGRGQAANQVYADLAARLAGVQQATVAQGNAGAAGLAAQNAAAQASGGNIPGAPPAPSIPTGAATAVLGAQTAAAGNYGGDLQRAAYSSGAQANQRALDAGTVAATTASNDTQKTLASLLAGVPLQSARESDMRKQNQSVDATNVQTAYSVYSGLQTAKSTAAALGNKQAEAQADRDLRGWLAQQNNATKVKLGISANATKTAIASSGNRTKAQIAKDNAAARVKAAKVTAAAKTASGGTAGGVTASGKRQALTQAIKIATAEGGKKTSSPTTYTVKIQAVTASGKPNPLSQPTSVTIPAAQVTTWKPPKGYQALGTPAISKTTSKTVDRPGGMTKYNRAVSYLKSTGYTDAEARAALKQYHP